MRGVKAAKTGRGLNPYRNERLKVLFDRGRENTPRGVAAPAPLRASGNSSDSGRSRSADSRPPRTGTYGRDSGFGRDSGGYGRRRV
jgi:hypothetical protein